ncbi:MAG: hypothetical protein HY741_22170 [Chloroflexi bacterium]|nr:hypothetical protein [Chloroflexota bacterium]
MELEKLRAQEPESGDPFRGNRWFRIAIIALGVLAVIGVLVFLLLILGFCAPNRQAANPTPTIEATAVVIVVTQPPATGVATEPTTASATATLVLAAPTLSATALAPATTVLPAATSPSTQPAATATSASAPPTQAGSTTSGRRLPTPSITPPPPSPLTGLSIAGLRYEPPRPVRNDPVYFFATITNRTGQDQNYPVCADVFLPGRKNPLGTTDCNMVTMVPGTAEIPIGFWIGTGIKECIPLRARVVMREQGGELRIPFTTDKGAEFWIDLSVCP